VTADQATVHVVTRLRNALSAAKVLTASIDVRDASGGTVARATQQVKAAPGASELAHDLKVARPHLWNGTEDPYLYTVRVELLDGNRVVDRVEQPLGIRTFHFDPNDGFSLNGHHLQLHGVSRHQDREGKGWALSPEDHADDMALIQEIGANTVRLAHYEHADEWVGATDKAGMVAWAEVPFVSEAALGTGEATPATVDNAKQQLRELIRQDYNHPSIVMWSVGNEINASQIYATGGKPSHPLSLLQDLNRLAKQEDPTRPTTFADCCEDSAYANKNQQVLAGTTDLIGYNRYFGWYYGKVPDMGPALDALHAKHPDIPMSVTEYGAGGALSQYTDNLDGGNITAVGRVQPEEYQSWYHEEAWKQLKARKYLYATWVWNMFDFASNMRAEGDSVDLNSKGLVAFDHKTRKDAFYFYQANWSKTPVIHLTGKRYADRAYPVMTVKAYSNAEKVRLTVNGVDKGEVACPDSICVWPSVTLAPGPNKAVVTASIGGQTISDDATWNGPQAAAGIHIKSGSLLVQTIDRILYGSDTFFDGGKTVAGGGLFAAAGPSDPRVSSWRYGDHFKYAIPVSNGHWKVTVHTLDPTSGTTADTLMSVAANGQQVVAPFNVLKAAGDKKKDAPRTFEVDVKEGVLTLDFIGTNGPAVVGAIDVTP
jgi:beta-galactosidase